ncbi:MAG: hypothetical protein FWF57_03675 [Defluviitaleaceae bacterium]|nr:hypothetical protein [Defluviitaleaceae bacterium]
MYEKNNLSIKEIENLLSKIVDKVINVNLKNNIGTFKMGAYKIIDNKGTEQEIILIYKGEISDIENVRINSACFSSDLFGDTRCDCNEQLQKSINYINSIENGMVIYLLNQDGRGQGTVNKLKSYYCMDKYNLTSAKSFQMLYLETDIRNFELAATILHDNKITSINMITNNPEKIKQIEKYGIKIKNRISIISERPELQKYLISKKEELQYLL